MISLNVYTSTTGGSKRDIMKAFGQGASKHGVKVSYVEQHNYIKSDFAMVFAYKSEGTDSPNHRFRQEVVSRHNDNIFFVDSNVLVPSIEFTPHIWFPIDGSPEYVMPNAS